MASKTNLTPEEEARAAAFREKVAAKNAAKQAGIPEAQYVTNEKGQTTSQYTQGNATYNVAKDSVYDPLSSNYNQIVANSGGKITLADLDANGKIISRPVTNPTVTNNSYNSDREDMERSTPQTYAPSYNPTYTPTLTQTAPQGTLAEQLAKFKAEYDKNKTQASAVSSPTATVTTTTTSTPAQTAPQFDIAAELEKLRKAQADAAISSLGKARDSALSNLSREKEQIAPAYNAKRNAASTSSQLQAKDFAEFMAGRGGTSSGVAAQAEMNRQGNLQGQIGSLNRAETNALSENSRRVSDVQNAYSSDVASAEAGAYTSYLQNMVNELNTQRQLAIQQDQFGKQFGLQEAGVTGNYNGSPTLGAQQLSAQINQNNFSNSMAQQQLIQQMAQAQFQRQLAEAGLTGMYNGQQTLDAQNQAFQQALQQSGVTGYYNGSPTFANQQYQTGVDQWNKQYQTGLDQYNQEYQDRLAQQEFENWLAKQQLALSQQKASSGGSGYSGSSNTLQSVENANASTRKYVTQIIGALQSGATMPEILADIDEIERTGRASAEKVDTKLLRDMANSVPMDNWQRIPGY